MKILSMTATFGKLEGQTLTLQPGLNVIHAPNEWGKSTWCAFIGAMLYGIETSQRTSSKGLADKEHYAPWSGKPMSGRMDIDWNGRKITLERSTKGRSIFGVFRAYETESGLDVTELTGDNCGQVLLGVEKSVFTRSAFLRFSDLPVTQDEALRRRLNALVTTGDETGKSDKLAQKLKELKNACRHNKTGLLPQAQAQRLGLQEQLNRLDSLENQAMRQRERLQELEQQLSQLQNHQAALSYEAYCAQQAHLKQAQDAENAIRQKVDDLRARCAALPTPEEAEETLTRLSDVQEQLNAMQNRSAPPVPEPPQGKHPFLGLNEQQTLAALNQDLQQYAAAGSIKAFLPGILIFLAGCALALVLKFLLPQLEAWCVPAALIGFLPLMITAIVRSGDGKLRAALEAKYGSKNPAVWQTIAQSHIEALHTYEQSASRYQTQREALRQEQAALQQQVMALTQGAPITAAQKYWQQVQASHRQLAEETKALQQAQNHTQALQAMVQEVPAPAEPDTLTLTQAQTQQAQASLGAEYRQLQQLAGQLTGQMETLGSREQLQRELTAVEQRIEMLLRYESALTLAQETLAEAASELQRQFAPRITKRAQAIFGKLTGGRYERLTLGEDLSVSTGAQGETLLYASQWRSDGTIDQLYLALRLAVAGELTPQAPLILDDVLVRFDDTRTEAAIRLLKEEDKQVILFTCQEREQQYI